MAKKYLADLLTEETYSKWISGKKLIIQGPTGIGKNYFTLKVFAPYCKRFGKRVLILCNRKLLKEQYQYDFADQYPRYVDMEDNVGVLTYQQLAEVLKRGEKLENLLRKFDVVICDECHFFYSDADFNGLGTYVLLQALVKEAFFKTIIFMSATVKEVLPMIEKTLMQCQTKIQLNEPGVNIEPFKYNQDIYNFSRFADFSRFSCHFFTDVESLAAEITKSEKKSVLFIDDSIKATAIKNYMVKTLKVPADDIKMLSAQIMEENPNERMIREISVGNRLPVKILITTSVLDNGVSIHDPDVGNVVIATESRVSFLQMLGRVRSEQVAECRLFIYPRETGYYEKRVLQYKEKLVNFKKLDSVVLNRRYFQIVSTGWYGNDEAAEFLRNAVVFTKNEYEYFSENFNGVRYIYPDPILAVNAFAREKVGNMLQAEESFLRLSYKKDVAAVAREQISWIGKGPDELVVWTSSYREEREQQLRDALLKINGFSNEELQDAKETIAKEFRKDILSDLNLKQASFSRNKLLKICDRYNLLLKQGTNSEGKAIYTICENKNTDLQL